MRITGGIFRGRKLNVPHLPDVRPTTDRARESLMNWLSNRVGFSGLTLTELFAGSGAITFELMSRGVPKATCVDLQAVCCATIQSIAHQWQLPLDVVCADALQYVESAPPVDIVFADPPYRLPQMHTLPRTILESSLLAKGGLLILEHDRTHDFVHLPGYQESRRYGEAVFSIFEV